MTDLETKFLKEAGQGKRRIGGSSDEDNKAKQKLRRAGLIEFGGKPAGWSITDKGRAVLAGGA